MQYFVIAPDGQKYGPADVPTLNHWAEEGRIVSTTMLEDAATGQIVPATQLPGLMIVPTAPISANYQNPHAAYPRGPAGGMFDNGDNDVRTAWTLAIIGLCMSFVMGICCSFLAIFNVFSILGIVFSSNAKKKGNPNAKNPMICSIVGLVIGPAIFVIIMIASQVLR